MELTIRSEQPADNHAIREINRIAFGGEHEAEIIDALRCSCPGIISLRSYF